MIPTMWFCMSPVTLWLAVCAIGVYGIDTSDEMKSIPLRTHTLSQPYLDSDMQSRWWDFGGDTIIRTDQYVRLTADKTSRDGWLFSRVPLTATNWEIEVEFKIHGSGNLHGDGFAIWITKQRAQQGQVFGSTDNFDGLGIFFDTYKNNRPGVVFPYVMAMYGDGQTSYDKANDGKNNEYGGCSARGIRGANVPTKARIKYFQDKSLKLELQYRAEDRWELCFEKDNPPPIPSVAYLGFSAETGELSDNHDIISVQTKNLYKPGQQGNIGTTKSREKGKSQDLNRDTGGGWAWFFIRTVIFILVVVGAYVGYTAWRNSKKTHRF